MLVSTSVSLARLSILAGTVVALALTVVRFFGDVRLRPEGLLRADFGLVVEPGSVVQGFSTTQGLIVCVSWARTWQASTSAANMNANPSQTFLVRDFNQSRVLFV